MKCNTSVRARLWTKLLHAFPGEGQHAWVYAFVHVANTPDTLWDSCGFALCPWLLLCKEAGGMHLRKSANIASKPNPVYAAPPWPPCPVSGTYHRFP
mmetsp:Transcript_41703/g.132647  ORF Transcript_41703/g.132647 Transcript_41703/m.132647 type:complete len:97 (-) Transcript_41703:1139-1429(-)